MLPVHGGADAAGLYESSLRMQEQRPATEQMCGRGKGTVGVLAPGDRDVQQGPEEYRIRLTS